MSKTGRILLAKVGFDGHDRGVKILATVFRDAGHDVIYLGKYLTTDQVVAAALQEDVDVIGLSFLGGAHITYCEEIQQKLAAENADDILLLVGGVIPHKDMLKLNEMGIEGVFATNTDTRDILKFLDDKLPSVAA